MRRIGFILFSVAAASLALFVFLQSVALAGQTGGEFSDEEMASARIHPELLRALEDSGDEEAWHRIIVEYRRSEQVIPEIGGQRDRLAQRRALIRALQADQIAQAGALGDYLLAKQAAGEAQAVRVFWASPIVALRSPAGLVRELASRPDVVQVRLDKPFELEDFQFQRTQANGPDSGLLWNLEMIQAQYAEELLGLDGRGVVVASLDSGVDWQHPALMSRYRGYNPKGPSVHPGNWYVATDEQYIYPGDGNGHGTHTVGTILGEDRNGQRIGVAPGAQWIAVKLFRNDGLTYESWIHDAFQWVLAPLNDPALAPDIVNNSWGSFISSDERYRFDLLALRAAGILPVFSAGNNGPRTGSVNSPASYPEALAVGAIDQEKYVASFSARGPSPWSETKPELAAPGVDILSSLPGGGYALADGTSMAAPHVAGIAALLRQANPDLTPDELESLLKSSAEPLGLTSPNNKTGWGLANAYTAGLQATASGELLGWITRPGGQPVESPLITISTRDGSPAVRISGGAGGEFRLGLRPGLVDVHAQAFGFQEGVLYAVEIITGAQVTVGITLAPLPVGSIFGQVTDIETGLPLSATLSVDQAPVKTQTNPGNGSYSLALPQGEWPISVFADAHRIAHFTATVVIGQGEAVDIALEPGPRILLVDSGRWYYDSQALYYEEILRQLGYPYGLWAVRDPFGENGLPADRPGLELLQNYDVVIWSAPQDSPGMISSGSPLSDYLALGGKLLISGQDVAFWDAGGSIYSPWQDYLWRKIGVAFSKEGFLGPAVGTPGGLFSGLQVEINTPDSAAQQVHPDSVRILAERHTTPLLAWQGGEIAGVAAGICTPYQAAYLGFGLEGAGPQAARAQVVDAVLDWFGSPPVLYDVHAEIPNGVLITPAGTQISQTIQLGNNGVQTDTYDMIVSGGSWPISIELPDGRRVEGSSDLVLSGCSQTVITATVSAPPGIARDSVTSHVLQFISRSAPNISSTITLTAKTPAAVLLVDDERWYNYEQRYIDSMSSLEASFDVISSLGGDRTPDAEILNRYKIVVWTTGYDWLRPLGPQDEANLASFLDQGGRLLLSSQDLLDVRGMNDFVRDRLGVASRTLTITATEVTALPGSVLGLEPELWKLVYPFMNWSDGLIAGLHAEPLLVDKQLFPVGLLRTAPNWRTAFFSIPMETLDETARQRLMSELMLKLSPLGESRLEALPAAGEGSQVPITLTLGSATTLSLSGLRAALPLPQGTTLVPGSLSGPWAYEAESGRLVWNGSLDPGEKVLLGGRLQLEPGIPPETALPLQAELYAGDGLTVTAQAAVQVNSPWLRVTKQVTPQISSLDGLVDYRIEVQNVGSLPATASLEDVVPDLLGPLPETIAASHGSLVYENGKITWSGEIPPAERLVITYRAGVLVRGPGARLVNWVWLAWSEHQRIAWAELDIPAAMYLPLVR